MGEMTLREALRAIQYEAERENGSWVHLKRCIAVQARQALASTPARKYALGDRLTKTKGSSWTGRVVGFYSTSLTPIGYCVESENEPGSVQLYPERALTLCDAGEHLRGGASTRCPSEAQPHRA